MTTRRISVVNESNHLIAAHEVEEDHVLASDEFDLDPGDLPLDGTYKLDREVPTFIPLGHGIPLKTKRPPIPDSYAYYLTMKVVRDKLGVPTEVSQWMEWYEDNLLRRDEERTLRAARSAAREEAIKAKTQ